MTRKEIYVLIVFAFILLGIIVILAIYGFSRSSNPKPTPPIVSPTQSVNVPTIEPKNPPVVSYDEKRQEQLLDSFTQRKALSPEDAAAKRRILSLLPPGQKSGILYKSETILIDYTSVPDDITGEILTTNIKKAKTEAVSWLRAQGMSQAGICNLPFSFYLNYQVAEQLRGSTVVFNPLPEGC